MIYTFYSFKGGVGRSMALANVAELMYRRGLRVLLIDFDLEAPGLERFFETLDGEVQADEVTKHRGIIDLLISYKELYDLPRLDTDSQKENISKFPHPVEPLSEFVVPIYKSNLSRGSISIVSAGMRHGENFSTYAQKVRAFNWDTFYSKYDGESFFEWFRGEIDAIADVVLIDSRTGVTEMGGVCLYHLADVVVMFIAPNTQNVEGTRMVAESLTEPELIRKGRQGRRIDIIAIPSRVEQAEKLLLDQFEESYKKQLSPFITKRAKFENNPFIELKIPYVPYYAYNEQVVAREPQRASATELLDAFNKITNVLASLAPSESAIRKLYGASRTKEIRYLTELIKRFDNQSPIMVLSAEAIQPEIRIQESISFRQHSLFDELELGRRRYEDVCDAITSTPRSILIGQAGSGKTTTLMRLARMLAERALDDASAAIPVFIPLRSYAKEKRLREIASSQFQKLDRFRHYWDSGQIFLILDGLDELEIDQARLLVEELTSVEAFVVSSRPHASVLDELEINALEVSLLPPSDHALDDYIERLLPENAARNFINVIRQNENYQNLARNPLFLQMLVQVYSYQGKIPSNRGKLYQTMIEYLLRSKEKFAGIDIDAATNVIAQTIHKQGISASISYDAASNALKEYFIFTRRFKSTAYSRSEIKKSLEAILTSGILIEDQDKIRFAHRTFSEYFAARELSRAMENGDNPRHYWKTENWWQESEWDEVVILLAGITEKNRVAKWINDWKPTLAAQCLIYYDDVRIEPDASYVVTSRLVQLLEDELALKIPAKNRIVAGHLLARIGDSRSGIGVRGSDRTPDIDFVEIPGGMFIMGSEKSSGGSNLAPYADETPVFQAALSSYRISRYPITNMQFSSFVEDGYHDDRWWNDLVQPKSSRVRQRLVFENPVQNEPCTFITWYEAVAFCRWLSVKLGFEVRLPTEMEWEKAARGTDGRIFTHGDTYQPYICNGKDAGLDAQSPVGSFSESDSIYGVKDMMGNVMEWCINSYHPYPLNDNSELLQFDPSDNEPRILRGGSFRSSPRDLRCASRSKLSPSKSQDDIGFRIVTERPV